MTASCKEQILAALDSLLGGLAGITYERGREQPVAMTSLPFVTVYDEGDTPQQDFASERGFTLPVTIEGVATGATKSAAGLAADTLRVAVLLALWADITLGGLTRDLRFSDEPPPPSLEPEVPEEAAGFVIALELEYATSETDPTAFA